MYHEMHSEYALQNEIQALRQSQAMSTTLQDQSNLTSLISAQVNNASPTHSSSIPGSDDTTSNRARMIMNVIGPQRATQISQSPQSRVGMGSSASRHAIERNSSGISTSHRAAVAASPHPDSRNATVNGSLVHPDGWRNWQEVSVKLSRIPETLSVHSVREHFGGEGNVVYLEIFDRYNEGRVTFRPPPARAFWEQKYYRLNGPGRESFIIGVKLDARREAPLFSSLTNPKRKYPEYLGIEAKSLDFGFMYKPGAMMSKRRILASRASPIRFGLNMRHREVVFRFDILNQTQQSAGAANDHSDTMMFSIPFQQLQNIRLIEGPAKALKLLVILETPPRFFKKVEGSYGFDEKARIWTERDSWYRQTDLVSNRAKLRISPVTLKKVKPGLDLGRWTTYYLRANLSERDEQMLHQISQALQDYNVPAVVLPQLTIVKSQEPFIWNIIDSQPQPENEVNERYKSIPTEITGLSFDVRYQLEVCISRGVLNEHNMTEDFVEKLRVIDHQRARELLEYLVAQKSRVFDPMSIFDIEVPVSTSMQHIPLYCTLVRSVTVTPTTLHFNTPTVETSNRILRQYHDHTDRFIRVRFTDEITEGKIYSTHKDTQNEVFTRVKRTMRNGITIGDRHYKFLAFGNSQIREHGAYFFAPTADLGTSEIRDWMGFFGNINVVAKFGSRLGQCFSTTRAIATQAEVVEIDDIKRNGYTFSDGVGKMSLALAQITADDLGITDKNQEPPSVFQFRLGGCKGVLTVWPELKENQLHIRESQYKFPASHEGLEVIRWSHLISANLNRQLILILSTLGVSDRVFKQKLKHQLMEINEATEKPETALKLLQRQIDHNQMTLKLAGMIIDGFQTCREPFIMSLLQLWRAWSIKYLKEKARISIEKGALLIGCLDETGILKGYFKNAPKIADNAPKSEKVKHLPEIFIQLSKGSEGKPEIILGPMLIARNPSLHPGDIRVVCGVDVPQLRHLKDCVVLPRTGDRDIANMCSGGDLDGDDFEVIWDQDLLPKEWNHEPLSYTDPPKLIHNGPITDDDLTNFFINYMKNDSLPKIAHAHVANADMAELGVKDPKCLELATLHSTAVDYVKSGRPAVMSKHLVPRKWPHFMEKKGKPANKIYISKKILGQLYDLVERIAFTPAFESPFDERILNAYDLSRDMTKKARNLKKEYDAHMKRIMAQHAIKSEFEVWSTFVMDHNGANDFKFHEEIGRVSMAIKDQFRALCWEKAGGKHYEQMAPFAAAMYKVTAEEMVKAVQKHNKLQGASLRQESRRRQMTVDTMPLMSFPWLFQDVLGKIARLNTSTSGEANITMNLIDDFPTTQVSMRPMVPKAIRANINAMEVKDDLKTAQGITHRGDLLELQFGDSQPRLGDHQAMMSPASKVRGEAEVNNIDAQQSSALDPNRGNGEHRQKENEQETFNILNDSSESNDESDEEIVELDERIASLHVRVDKLNGE